MKDNYTKIPGNWQAFQWMDENKMELIAFLAKQAVTITDERKVISTCGKQILITLAMEDISNLSPCTHEQAVQDFYCILQTLQLLAARGWWYRLLTQMWLFWVQLSLLK